MTFSWWSRRIEPCSTPYFILIKIILPYSVPYKQEMAAPYSVPYKQRMSAPYSVPYKHEMAAPYKLEMAAPYSLPSKWEMAALYIVSYNQRWLHNTVCQAFRRQLCHVVCDTIREMASLYSAIQARDGCFIQCSKKAGDGRRQSLISIYIYINPLDARCFFAKLL